MDFPTLWVLPREAVQPAPWGITLHLDV
jgi:hypothetical protein